jgi:hypothetical protein
MKYQIYLIDPDTEQPALEDRWGIDQTDFDNLSDAEEAVAELERVYPGTKWQIRDLQET